MGFEFRLRFSHAGEALVASALLRLPGAVEVAEPEGATEIRASNPAARRPDGVIQPTPDGAYFCDFGSPRSALLGAAVGTRVESSGAITIEEWE